MKSIHFVYLFFVLVNYNSFCFSQSIALPSDTVLFHALRSYHSQLLESQVAEFSASEKYKWMQWLPSVGFQTGFDLVPRPTLVYSLNQVYTNLNAKEQTKQKILSLQLSARLGFLDDSLQIVSKLRELKIRESAIAMLESETRIDDKIWEVVKDKWHKTQKAYADLSLKNPLDPDVYLNEKKSYYEFERQYLERGERLSKTMETINLLKIEILRVSKVY